MKTVITFGTFDVFHIGHLNILQRARALGERLVVGVSSDELNILKKNRIPIYLQDERMRIISALKCADEVFLEESLDLKADYIRNFNAKVLVMGDDWKGEFDIFSSLCEVVYINRTPMVSTTSIIETIKNH